jgi:hypothetical protein
VSWRELLFDNHAGVRALAQQTALDAGGEPDVEYRAGWQPAVPAASESR